MRPINRHARGSRVPFLAGIFLSNYGTARRDAREKMSEVDYSSPFTVSFIV
jgi:hypothetical protein